MLCIPLELAASIYAGVDTAFLHFVRVPDAFMQDSCK